MPTPGSSHALVLPTSSEVAEDPAAAGERLCAQLEVFLVETKYTALAVVHGLGMTAPNAFDKAKQRRPGKGGVVWVTDAKFLGHLAGTEATLLKRLLKPTPRYVMTFVSVHGRRVTGRLHWAQLRDAEVDLRYADAALNQLTP